MSEMTSTEMTALNQRSKRGGRFFALLSLFGFLLVLFTVLKLPQNKITQLIQGYVQQGLDPMGIYLTHRGAELSVLRGFQYRLDHPTLELTDGTRVELDELVVNPSLLSLLQGKAGATIRLTQGASTIEVTGKGKGDQVDAQVSLDQCDIARLGLLSFAGGLKGGGLISGEIQIQGSLQDLTTLKGDVQLKLKKIRLDEQNMMGFELPTISVSEGTIELKLENGKLNAKNVNIGKATDDLQAQLTGDLTLNRYLNASTLNMRAVLGLADKIKQSIPLLDSILGSAKQGDGKYAYKLTGTLGQPFPLPDPSK